MAYSETMLGLQPLYGVWRILGIGPGGAYQLWFVSIAVLNFLLLCGFLRKVMELHRLPAALDAHLFAFASSRVNQIGHSQLWAEFYASLAVWLLIRFLRLGMGESNAKAVLWPSAASAAVALQLIAGFYFGWFLCFSLLVACAVILVQTGPREELCKRVRRFWPALPTVRKWMTSRPIAEVGQAAGRLTVR
jgi:hypothetical protein